MKTLFFTLVIIFISAFTVGMAQDHFSRDKTLQLTIEAQEREIFKLREEKSFCDEI